MVCEIDDPALAVITCTGGVRLRAADCQLITAPTRARLSGVVV
jgi:hypothetical protein